MQEQKNNAILFSGGDINTYLKSLGTGYGVDSQVRITTEPTAVDEDKMYYICANFQEKIKTAVDSRKRKSARLDPQQARKRFCIDDFNRVTVVFEDKAAGVLEENHIFPNDTTTTINDATEEVRVEVGKEKTRTGHRQKFPEDILKF